MQVEVEKVAQTGETVYFLSVQLIAEFVWGKGS